MESMKDKVAVIGMVCAKLDERCDAGLDDLAIEAAYEAYENAGIDPEAFEACWYGSATQPVTQENTGMTPSTCLRARRHTYREDRRKQRGPYVPHTVCRRTGLCYNLLAQGKCLFTSISAIPATRLLAHIGRDSL